MGCGASNAIPHDPRFDADGNRIGYEDPRTSRYHLERKRGYLTQDPQSLEDYRELLRIHGVDTEEPDDSSDNITVISNSATGSPLGLRPALRHASMRSLISPDSCQTLKSARPTYETDFGNSTDIISIRFAPGESPRGDSFSNKRNYQSPPPAPESWNSSMAADQSPLVVPHSTSWALPNRAAPSSSSSSGDGSPDPDSALVRKNVSFGELDKEPTRMRNAPSLRRHH
jgi:hypothetical protein